MKTAWLLLALLPLAAAPAAPPLLPPAEGEAIGAELSGSAALRTVRTLSQHHRMRGSDGYRAAAEAIRDRLSDSGLEGVEIISLPADGRIFYGTQRSRPGWNARFAELWEGAAADRLLGRAADQPRPGQRLGAGRRRSGRCRRGDGGERLCRPGRARQIGADLLPAGRNR